MTNRNWLTLLASLYNTMTLYTLLLMVLLQWFDTIHYQETMAMSASHFNMPDYVVIPDSSVVCCEDFQRDGLQRNANNDLSESWFTVPEESSYQRQPSLPYTGRNNVEWHYIYYHYSCCLWVAQSSPHHSNFHYIPTKQTASLSTQLV